MKDIYKVLVGLGLLTAVFVGFYFYNKRGGRPLWQPPMGYDIFPGPKGRGRSKMPIQGIMGGTHPDPGADIGEMPFMP